MSSAMMPIVDRKYTKLNSDLEIVTDAAPTAETLSISVSFRVGSCDEGEFPHGIAHFMEHMAFKGTTRRTAHAINDEISNRGGSLNASTDWDTTSFTCVTLREELTHSLDVLADIVTDPLLRAEDVELERNVIMQELDQGKGTWATLEECFYASAYGEQDIARPIIGTEDGVAAVTPDALRAFMQRHYVSGNAMVAVAGAVSHDDVVSLVAEKFAGLPQGPRNPMPAFTYQGGEQGFACSCERGIVKYGFAAPNEGEPGYYPLVLFRNITGYGPSSRLYRELRERRGLVYNVDAYPVYHCGSGLAVYQTESDASKIKEILLALHDVLLGAAADLSEAELIQAKRLIKAWDRMNRDSMQSRTTSAVFDLFAAGRLRPLEESHAGFDAVTLEEVREAGRRMLASAPTLAVHGPARGMPKLAHLKGRVAPAEAA